jgi:hypothetical protein
MGVFLCWIGQHKNVLARPFVPWFDPDQIAAVIPRARIAPIELCQLDGGQSAKAIFP